MAGLLHQRCFNHADREAVARCPECRQYYCRECIAEHSDRMLCAFCLRKLGESVSTRRIHWGGAWKSAQFLAGLALVWIWFYGLGELLLQLRHSFHEDALQRSESVEEP